jgi:hypothetical protein
MKLSENFTLAEMIESPTARRLNYTEQFEPPLHVITNLTCLIESVLQPMRTALSKPITVTSGYRCERLNKRVKGAKNSQHVGGEAADIRIHGLTTDEIVDFAIRFNIPFDQIIEEFGSWVHISFSQVSNRREALRATKNSSDRTVYTKY